MKKIATLILMGFALVTLTGCQDLENYFKNAKEDWIGLSFNVNTYDENSQIIDSFSGKSLSISRNKTFDTEDNDGYSKKDSSVVKITLGKYEIDHVGSSLIAEEKGLTNIFTEYRKTVDINNQDSSIPVVNRMLSSFSNSFAGKSKVILIRSQSGVPLATYAGNHVSLYNSDVPKTSEILIDGKKLVIYRCDYTIYDKALLE